MPTTTSDTPVEPSVAEREPKGYVLRYGLSAYGVNLAILTPVMGGLAIKLQNLNAGDLGAATAQLSLVTGIGALFALFTQPLVGRFSDRTTSRWGMRRPWLIAGVLGAAASLVLIGLASSLAVVLVGWCLSQTFSNVAQAAQNATLPDQVPVHRRGLVSGIYGAAMPLAILTGAVGLAQLDTDLLRFAGPATIGLACGLWFAATLKDRRLLEKPEGRVNLVEVLRTFVFNPRRYPDLGWAWFTKFLVMFGYASTGTFMLLFLAARFEMTDVADQAQFNMYATFVAVTFMVLSSVVGGRWSDRTGVRKPFVAAGGLILAAGILVIALSPVAGVQAGLVVILVGQALVGTGAGMFLAVDLALCTEVLPNPEDTAKDLGVLNVANALPQSLAPMAAGPIILAVNSFGGEAGYSVWFAVGAVAAACGGALIYKIKGVR